MELDRLINQILEEQTLENIIPDAMLRGQITTEFEALATIKTNKLSESDTPLLINISGIPGSGKTTLAKQILSNNSDLLYISFDEIMESMPHYKSDFKLYGAEEAYKRWELPARYFGYKLLEQALKNRYSILFEHSNALQEHILLYEIIKKMQYRVEIRFIDIDINIAIERAKQRSRFVPEELIRDRQKSLNELNQQYQKIVDSFIIVKTS